MNTSTRSHDALALLQEQQTAKALYGATESRFCRYYAEAARRPGLVGDNLLQVSV
jgi:small subunit ribosomal protein S4